ncbi:MAG: TonB-dependent receptor [Opitutaceae bacterium]|nr:TonB-dependent receptor [Cytophagales bacterium]
MKKYILIPFFTFITVLAFGQDTPTEISGKIIDSTTNEPLIAVIVNVKGSTNSVITDENGAFKLKTYRPYPITLQVSFIGYKLKEYEVTGAQSDLTLALSPDVDETEEVVVTSRRREEVVQDIPIPISVVGGKRAEDAGLFNVNRVKELIPSVQLYSSNPRNSGLTIRGLGSTFGLTNDGIDPGVGFYVDGVYYARPAVTALDFVDIERIEVLRGPQGTLFGKNTTAGAFNVVTRAPSFKPGANIEVSYGNYNYTQAKASVTGPLGKYFAARASFSGTQRQGTIYNAYNQKFINNLDNQGVRGQLLFTPSRKIKLTLTGDYNTQKPEGYAQVIAGVAPTQRAAYRQFNNIISDLNYTLPTTNPYDRVVDQNTTAKSHNDLGGVSLNADFKIGRGTLSSTTAWRFWTWNPSTDRDFTGLSVLQRSQANSRQEQVSEEIRYAGNITDKISGVVGVYGINQSVWAAPVQIEEAGKDQWRFSIDTDPAKASAATITNWKTALTGFGTNTYSTLNSTSAAAFANVDFEVFKNFHIQPGIRYNYDQKKVDYVRETFGGPQNPNAAQLAIQKKVYSNQSFNTTVDNTNLSGILTLSYKPSKHINTYGTYSTSYKPIGINLSGLPTQADGTADLNYATVKPEYVNHFELGIKTSPTQHSTLNITGYNTDVSDFQTQVQSPELGVNRGYLANAEHVRVQGLEFDGTIKVGKNLSFNLSVAYTEAKYVTFTNAPLPLEETGTTTPDLNNPGKTLSVNFKDISGAQLPGISKWAGSLGGEVTSNETKFVGQKGKFFLGLDGYSRSSFSSSPTPSQYLNINEYALLNGRLGFRASSGLSAFIWGRNILNKNYMEQLLPAGGNAGQYAAVLGDPQTYGITLRYTF